MNKESVVSLLKALGVKQHSVSGKWISGSCPLAPWLHDSGKDSSPSFAINVNEQGPSGFNCFACRSGKNLGDLVLLLQHLGAENPRYDLGLAWEIVDAEAAQKIVVAIKDWGETEKGKEDVVFPEEWLQWFKPAWLVPYARDYLLARQVDELVAGAFDIRWDYSKRTVCFPVRNRQGQLVSLRGRYIDPAPGAPTYYVYRDADNQQTGTAWLGEHWVDYDKPVLWVESVFDATSVWRVYKNVMAPLTVGMGPERFLRVGAASDVVTLFDRGKGGDKARSIVSKRMGSALIRHLIPPAIVRPPDASHPTEWVTKDPGDLKESELRDVLRDVLPGV